MTQLRTLLGATRVYSLIQHRQALERHFNAQERHGMGIVRYTARNQEVIKRAQEEIAAELTRLGVSSEHALLHLVHVQLPQLVLVRAKQLAMSMLDRNEEIVKGEMARYAEQVCSPDLAGLLAADAELGARQRNIDSTKLDIRQATHYTSGIPGGVPTTAAEYGIPPNEESIMAVVNNIDKYRATLENQQRELNEVRNNLGRRYPILMAKGYMPGSLSSAPIEDLAQLAAKPLKEITENIAIVRKAIQDDEIKVWNLYDVVEMAVADLGISRIPEYLEVVEHHIHKQRSDEGFIEKAKSALAILTTILAGFIGGPLGAGIVGGAWSTYFLTESMGEYLVESAANYVALDPEVRDISINEPQLLWVVLDLIGLGLDVGGAVRLLRPLARTALQTRRLGEFSEAARRIAPQASERLINSLRRRIGRETIEQAAVGARRITGVGKSLDEYIDALRAETHTPGSIGHSWDYKNHPRGLPESQWRPGDPIDMPNSRGGYPSYDKARERYWRNRADIEIKARSRGQSSQRPGVTTDPVANLSKEELEQMRNTGRAPAYAYPNKPGQTWELEHHGVPQRVRGWLIDLGFKRDESRRFIQESHPGSLMEVTPLEHAFFDAEAWGFGKLRGDITGATWAGTSAADIRGSRPLYYMSDQTITEIVNRATGSKLNFGKSATTIQLRNALRQEIAERGLGLVVP